MIKIAHVVRRFTFNEWGGTETVVWNTIKNQKRLGFQPEILATSALSTAGKEIRQGIPIRRFPYFYPYFPMGNADMEALDKKGGNPWSFQLFNALEYGDYDIVHIHCGGRLAVICENIARRIKIPSVLTLHGGAVDVPKSELREMLRPVRWKFHYGKIIDLLQGERKDMIGGADAVLCVNKTEELRLKSKYPNARVFYQPNGIDLSRFKGKSYVDIRKAYSIPPSRKIALCVSRIDYQKNQKLLLSILQNDADAHLMLIGPITSQWYFDELVAEIDAKGLRERTTIIKGLPPDSPILFSALKSADVFVLPSVHEPFGIAALEAWAAGIPLLAANVGGLKDFIEDAKTGLLFNPNSPESLVEAWRKIQDAELCGRLVANASERVKDFAWEEITKKLVSVYKEVQNAPR